MNELKQMDDKEKKEFLAMDLIERLIRLEQRVSASFGEFIPYPQTEYYKNLPEKQKKEFVKYLIKNKRKKYLICSILTVFICGFLLLYHSITGGIIGTNGTGSMFGLGLLIFLLVLGIAFFIKKSQFKKRRKKIDNYFKVIDNLYVTRVKK